MTLPVPAAPGTPVLRSAGTSLRTGRGARRDEAALYGLAIAVQARSQGSLARPWEAARRAAVGRGWAIARRATLRRGLALARRATFGGLEDRP